LTGQYSDPTRPNDCEDVVFSPPPGGERAFRTLRHRDFRLLWGAETISTGGTYINRAAMAWQVYSLTGSTVDLGLLGLVRFFPLVFFGIAGGVIADRGDRRRTLVVSQLVLLAASLLLGGLTFAGSVTIWVIYAVAFVDGSVSAVSNPTRQAIIPSLVPRESLGGASTMNNLGFHVSAVCGPAIGGLVIGLAGVGWAYALDAASFAVVAVAVMAIKTKITPVAITTTGLAAALEGLRFLRRTPVLLGVMVTDAIATFFGVTSLLMPVFAEEVFHVGPEGLGLLLAAPAAGAVISSGVLSVIRLPDRAGLGVLLSVAVYGLAMLGFGLTGSFTLALGFLALSGATDAVSMVYRHTIRAVLTPDALRGRVAALHRTLGVGGPQLGEFEAGIVASLIGAGPAVALGGALAAVSAGVIAAKLPAVSRYRLFPSAEEASHRPTAQPAD